MLQIKVHERRVLLDVEVKQEQDGTWINIAVRVVGERERGGKRVARGKRREREGDGGGSSVSRRVSE